MGFVELYFQEELNFCLGAEVKTLGHECSASMVPTPPQDAVLLI